MKLSKFTACFRMIFARAVIQSELQKDLHHKLNQKFYKARLNLF